MTEPTRLEVLAWLERTGRSVADAVTHFWGPQDAKTRERNYERVKKWAQRARKAATKGETTPKPASTPRPAAAAAPPPAGSGSSPSAQRAEAAAALGRVPFLQRQLVQLLQDMESARHGGDLRAIPQLDKRVAEVRVELDQAIELERQVVRLDRTATAIALELERRAEAIRIRAEIERRNQARRGEP